MSGNTISRKRKKKASLRELLWFEIDQRHRANKPPKISSYLITACSLFFVLSFFLFVFCLVLFPIKKINEPFGFIIKISQKGNIPVYDRV